MTRIASARVTVARLGVLVAKASALVDDSLSRDVAELTDIVRRSQRYHRKLNKLAGRMLQLFTKEAPGPNGKPTVSLFQHKHGCNCADCQRARAALAAYGLRPFVDRPQRKRWKR